MAMRWDPKSFSLLRVLVNPIASREAWHISITRLTPSGFLVPLWMFTNLSRYHKILGLN